MLENLLIFVRQKNYPVVVVFLIAVEKKKVLLFSVLFSYKEATQSDEIGM